jgi:hypothetical protein
MTIKRGDNNVRFLFTPKIDGVAMTPAQLLNCTVSFLLKGMTAAFKRAAQITPEAQFLYDAVSADVATAGVFYQEWELVDANGKVLTFPNDGYYQINIVDDLG